MILRKNDSPKNIHGVIETKGHRIIHTIYLDLKQHGMGLINNKMRNILLTFRN